MLNIIIGIIVICMVIAFLPYIIGLGAILLIGYLIISNLDEILTFIGTVFSAIIGNLHIIIGVVVFLAILGILYETYATIGRKKRLRLRNKIIDTINKLGMADCEQISNVLAEEKSIVLEELKVLVSLGEIDAEKMNQGDKAGEYVYKSLGLGPQVVHSNYQYEEINLE